MTAPLFLSPSKPPFLSSSLSSSSSFFHLKNPKPLNSLSNGATSFFLQSQNPFTPITKKDSTFTSEDIQNGDDGDKIKMPTAPWMNAPLLLPPEEVLDFSKPKITKIPSNQEPHVADKSLTGKISGRKGKKAMKKIVQSVENLHLVDTRDNWDKTQKNWGDFGGGLLLGKLERDGEEEKLKFGRKMPWESERTMVFRRVKKEKVPTAAELSLDKELLERLRKEGGKMRKWIKIMKAGVTQAVVDEVRSIWANNELAMLKFDLPLCLNMDRAHEIVEVKTGGLVVWRRKECIVVYRGCISSEHSVDALTEEVISNPMYSLEPENLDMEEDFQSPNFSMERSLGEDQTHRSLYEREGDRLLDGLGPRFIDWWYPKPLPVDGDMLPEIVPGFKPPLRLCPPRVFRAQLADDELTYLRKLARQMPVHFVLGRNSKLQGLAVSILKLWERTIIVKIAVKWGVQNTSHELMASELKRLTGGVLILRNKFFIILYRGKDFLPGNVANLVVEREIELRQWQLREEDARLRAVGTLQLDSGTKANTSIVGTFSEFQHIQTICGKINNTESKDQIMLEAEKERLQKEIRKQELKLDILSFKIKRVKKELSKLDSAWEPSEGETDQELITEEERACFRKIGLKMESVLVLGRRGVFDGVIEGLHQHWKHREVVKVISMQKTFLEVVYTARMIERESDGILVSIDKLKKGHAIIIYRGKNYKRPLMVDNLLDKKKALKRSLEMQRLGSLKFFAYQRQKEIADLTRKLADLEEQQQLLNERGTSNWRNEIFRGATVNL